VFAYEDLGAHTLKGVGTPVRLFRVLRELEARNDTDSAVGAGLTPLLGRDQEVGMLLERWSQVKDGHGQVVLLNGEAGIGKSRLVEAVKERVMGELHTPIELRCSPYYQHSALHPMLEVLHRQLRWRQEDSTPARVGKLESMLRRHGFSPPDVVPLFAALLALPLPDHYAPLALSPEGQKQKTLETLIAWLRRETEQYPVLLIVEDLHWLDPSTLEFLSLVVEQTATMRLFALFTYRPIFHPPWAAQAHLTHLHLNRLPRHQAALMIEQVAGGKALPPEVHQQLLTKTDGVPLFVEELTKMVLESGLLRDVGDRYELSGPLPPLAIPATLQDSLMARLDRLATGKLVAQLGATIGRQFDYALLQAVSPLDDATLQQALGQLVESELLSQSEALPGGTYIFRHALIQETAYLSLLRSTRQQYHQQIAMALVAHFPGTVETQPELVAHHYSEAGLAAQALPYWQRAGQRAIERSANLEAISHLTRGLEVLKTLPDTPQRTQQELTLQLALGPPLVMIKGYEAREVEQAYTRAQALCQQVGDRSQRFSVLVGLRRFYFGRGQLRAAREVAEECLALAQDLRNTAFLQEAHAMLGTTLVYEGELLLARTHLEQGLALHPTQPGRSLAFSDSTDPEVFCLTQLSWALWMLGYPEQALARSGQACALAHKLSQPYSLAYALVFASALSMFRREAQRVQEQAEAAIAIARERGFSRWLAVGMGWRGWALAEQGAVHEGLAQLLQAPAVGLSQQPLRLAEVYSKAGQPEAGLRVLSDTLAAVSKNGERRFEAELYRLQGELLLCHAAGTGDLPPAEAEAESCFRRAIEVARLQHAKSFELRAAMSLSRLWLRQSQPTAARDLLATVYGWFSEGFDTADLQEAKALLEAMP
jgi:predicted ATPase